jgi:hypothetical protein
MTVAAPQNRATLFWWQVWVVFVLVEVLLLAATGLDLICRWAGSLVGRSLRTDFYDLDW